MRPTRGSIETGVEDLPPAAKIHLKIGVKIVRSARVLIRNIRHVAAHVAGGQIKGSTECDRGMREVAADPIAALDDVIGREIRAARERAILDISVQPIADAQDPVDAVGKMAEILPREVEQLVGIAVARRQRVPQDRSRQEVRRDGLSSQRKSSRRLGTITMAS